MLFGTPLRMVSACKMNSNIDANKGKNKGEKSNNSINLYFVSAKEIRVIRVMEY
jgi:hypothetical protein